MLCINPTLKVNRKINIRVWDEINQQMIYPKEFFIKGIEYHLDEDDLVLMEQLPHFDTRINIYEEDIISFDATDRGGDCVIGSVVFNTDQTVGMLGFGIMTREGYHPTDFLGKIKILGNKFEDFELFKLVHGRTA